MSTEQLRERLEAAARAFQKAADAPVSLPQLGLFARATTFLADTWKDWRHATGIELSDAEQGVKDTFSVIYRLAQATGSDELIEEYTRDLVALTNELTAIKEEKLRRREGAYTPITDAIKAAAGDLKKAKERADELAEALGIAADLLAGFTKFLKAFG